MARGPLPAHRALARRLPTQNSFDLGASKDWRHSRDPQDRFEHVSTADCCAATRS
jgi:hypothetical protein